MKTPTGLHAALVSVVSIAAFVMPVPHLYGQSICPDEMLEANQPAPMCKGSSCSVYGASVVAENFPLTGSINALIVLVQHKNDSFEHCGELTGFDQLGIAEFVERSHAEYCDGTSDSWTIGETQSWTDDATTEWPVDLASGPTSNTRELPAWASSLIDTVGEVVLIPWTA